MTARCATTGLDADVCFGSCCVPDTTAEPFTDRELATLRRFEEAPAAPESLRERVARALVNAAYFDETPDTTWPLMSEGLRDDYRRIADAAITAIGEDARS